MRPAMSDLASLTLFPATPEQTLVSRNRTHVQWSRGRPLDEYLERDRVLDHHEHASDGKLITWVLAPRDDPTTQNFKCSCETFTRSGVLYNPKSAQLEDVICYGIASVFTPVEHRKQGYATHMMAMLHWVLAKDEFLPESDLFPAAWGSPPPRAALAGQGHFSALWSDVGPNLYRRCSPLPGQEGWVVRSPSSTIWKSVDLSKQELPSSSTEQWEWLGESKANSLWRDDALQMKEEILADAQASKKIATVSFLPDNGVAAFQNRRADFYTKQAAHQDLAWGVAEVGSSPAGTYATWTLDAGKSVKTLIITRIRATPRTFGLLLSKVLEAASKSNVEEIHVWSLPPQLASIATELGGTTKARDSSLPSIKCYFADNADVEWDFVEKFCWC